MPTLTMPPLELPAENEIYRLMGYPTPDSVSPQAAAMVAAQLEHARKTVKPWATVCEVEIDANDGEHVVLGGHPMHSAVLAKRLAHCKTALVTLVTIGPELELALHALQEREATPEALVLDSIGSAAVELIQRELAIELCRRHEGGSVRVLQHFSPGYTGWDLTDQAKLFHLLAAHSEDPLPVRLTHTSMMLPRKSISAVWGLRDADAPLGPDEQWEPCQTCDLTGCGFRRAPLDPILTSEVAATPASTEDVTEPESDPEPVPAPSFQYPISEKALAKWSRLYLKAKREGEGCWAYRFSYVGSTCMGGGRSYRAEMHMKVHEGEAGLVFDEGRVDLPDDEASLRTMCAYLQEGKPFVERLRETPSFSGQTIEAILGDMGSVNPAGCFCTRPMVLHKWRMALCTVHFAWHKRREQESEAG